MTGNIKSVTANFKSTGCVHIWTLQSGTTMGKMVTEIVALMLSISGWVLISSTLPTDYWKVSSVDGTVITTATFWSNLWKTCVTDSTGISNCKDFPSMLALDGLLFALLMAFLFTARTLFCSDFIVMCVNKITSDLRVLTWSCRNDNLLRDSIKFFLPFPLSNSKWPH